jgi:hypothetical protein
MAYASQAGRAKTSAKSPQAHAICDKCGFRYNFVNLQWQFDWRGASLQNLRILVCRSCLDTPQEQLRAIVVPADPTPIMNARVQDFSAAEIDNFAITGGTTDSKTGIYIPATTDISTEDDLNLSPQPIGAPSGLEPGAIMPLGATGSSNAPVPSPLVLQGTANYDVLLPVLSMLSVGTTVITVTCSAAHGLVTDSQVSVEGASNVRVNGFYSVTYLTATAFTFEVASVIPAGSLLTSTTQVLTANVGIPLGYTQIPQTGV